MKRDFCKKLLFICLCVACLAPGVSTPIALVGGVLFSITLGNPLYVMSKGLSKITLQLSVVGLGFGMNVVEAAEIGKDGVLFTVVSITLTLAVGMLLGRLLSTPFKTSLLISTGTAICGGSAIAAMAPVIDANEDETSLSLAVVFLLNSVALLIFPYLGYLVGMSQKQFGLWSAIAIHDTSSVVGAAQKFGNDALKIATTVKLERALWIIPVTLFFSILLKKGTKGVKIPIFILLFAGAMVLNSYSTRVAAISPYIVMGAKRALVLTLFLIGSGISVDSLKRIGYKPLIQGISIWIFISTLSLVALKWVIYTKL